MTDAPQTPIGINLSAEQVTLLRSIASTRHLSAERLAQFYVEQGIIRESGVIAPAALEAYYRNQRRASWTKFRKVIGELIRQLPSMLWRRVVGR